MKTLRTLWKSRNSSKRYVQYKARSTKNDRDMVHLLNTINQTHLKTLGCCSGHGKYPMTIVIKYVDGILELIIGKIISRKIRFYFKDKEEYYFIQETIDVRYFFVTFVEQKIIER